MYKIYFYEIVSNIKKFTSMKLYKITSMKSLQRLVGEKTGPSVGNYTQQRWTEAPIKCPQTLFMINFQKNFPERSISLKINSFTSEPGLL